MFRPLAAAVCPQRFSPLFQSTGKARWLRPAGLLMAASWAASLGIAACSMDSGSSDDAYLSEIGVPEGTAETCGVLRLANEASLEMLDVTVGLDSRAAANMIDYRLGPDGVAGTRDDERFDSIAELGSISYVKKSAYSKLLSYSEGNGYTCEHLDLQVLMVADWHGQLDEVPQFGGGVLGGAAAMSAYFQAERQANPNTIVLFAGDSFGASPPLAGFFEEQPVVEAMNFMRVDADAVGNHSFDRGPAHLQSMAELAQYPFLAANVQRVDENMTCESKPDGQCIQPYAPVWVGGLQVAVIGLVTPNTPNLVKPGNTGSIEFTDPVAAANKAYKLAAIDDARVFVALAHLGAETESDDPAPAGPLVDLAKGVSGYDLILGGHTHSEFNKEIAGKLVVETGSTGLSYARITLRYDFASRMVTERSAEVVPVAADAITADQAMVQLIDPYRTELAVAFDTSIATTSGTFERGNNVERLGEVPIGNLIADAIRERYEVDFAFVNGGGIRAPIPSSYVPANQELSRPAEGFAAGPPYDVVVGDPYAVLPFGNDVVTRTVTGAQLWAMLEHSVEALPAPAGSFGQVSGIRFVFDSSQPAGSRVTELKLADGTPIAADQTVYTMATSDFLAAGGDGYEMLAGGDGVARDKMADVLRDHLASLGTLTPTTDGRIVDAAAQ